MDKKRITINLYNDDYKYIQHYIKNVDPETNVCSLIRSIIKDGCKWMQDNEKK